MTSFELGINTCFAVKRWPRPEDWSRVVTDDLGLDLVQHSLDLVDLGEEVWRREADVVRRTCEAVGIRLHSTFTGLAAYSDNLLLHPDPHHRRRAEDWYARVIDFTGALGAEATGGHVGAFSVHDWQDGARRADLTADLHRALERLSRHAHRRHLRSLYVENLAAAREPATMADIAALVRPADEAHAAIELCLDVGHQCVPGSTGIDRDPYEWLARWGAAAGVIQLQQSDALADHHWPFTVETNLAGRIHAPRVLEVLRSTAARRIVLILEVIPAFEADDDQVRRDLVASVDYWRTAISSLDETEGAVAGRRRDT